MTRGQSAITIPRPARVIDILQSAYYPDVSLSVLQWWSTYLAQIIVYITYIEVKDGRNAAFLNLSKLAFLRVYPHIFVSRADVGMLRIDLMYY